MNNHETSKEPGSRQPLYYTFANHMHWVDMEWLWGYFVLPSSVRDMLHFCSETGTKGNINFDAIGYEKLAVEAPDALAELRDAVHRGQIEIAGASYGQPYGLFHPGESNVRQRVYGARTVRRLIGVWPKTFWEEEFDFFPQLPQMLVNAGHEYASLFFQWTWHTPEVPRESIPAVWWEGQDGTRLLTATRNALNLHQWPEDFQGLLDGPAPREMPAAGIQQWLELMPSPDWMCRSEVLLPQMRALIASPDYEIRAVTLPEYLDVAKEHAEPRRYTLDDVFHGMSLGKNGDLIRRSSHAAEHQLLAAESISALAGFFGRPYPSWNVYPTWELEESWRELLSAQHHDNDECEGLNGHIGLRSYERSNGLSKHVLDRTVAALAKRTAGEPGRTVIYNPLGWVRRGPDSQELPAFGYRVLESGRASTQRAVNVERSETAITLRRDAISVTIDLTTGAVTQITSRDFPDGVLRSGHALANLQMTHGGEIDTFDRAEVSVTSDPVDPVVHVWRYGREDALVGVDIALATDTDAIDIAFHTPSLKRPDGRIAAALQTPIAFNLDDLTLIHDHPYGVSEIAATGKTYLRKYPTGDWMTSPQVFEEVHNPFTALSLLDFHDGDRGVLYLHDGSQAFLRDGNTVRNVLSMYDPWDEDYFVERLEAKVRIVPHGAISNTGRWRLAQEFLRPPIAATATGPSGDLPVAFSGLHCDAPNVSATAFFRETPETGQFLDAYAGAGIDFPHVVRLVEFDGHPATTRLTVPGAVASARKASTRGDLIEALTVASGNSPIDGVAGEWSTITVELRPYEIATVYLDLIAGRKVNRDLDAHRNVWATIHRVEL